MVRMIVATRNNGKLREIEARLSPIFKVEGLDAIDSDIQIVEDAETFEGNALKKVSAIAAVYTGYCLSDDSGLEVDALNGAPGVHSARFGGEGLTDEDRCTLLLQKMTDIKLTDRTARFKTVLAFFAPNESTVLFKGTLEGTIAAEAAGTEGFGYDPIFIPTGFDKTLATLGAEIKNRISHRAEALDALESFLKKLTSQFHL